MHLECLQVGDPLGWSLDGWAGPVQTVTGLHPTYRRYREVIERLNAKIAAIEVDMQSPLMLHLKALCSCPFAISSSMSANNSLPPVLPLCFFPWAT